MVRRERGIARTPGIFVVLSLVVLSAALMVLARGTEETQETAAATSTPTPQPTPQPTPKPTHTPGPKTLSELAATIKLRTPTPTSDKEPKVPVISNDTVYPEGTPRPDDTEDGTSPSDWLKLSPKDQEEAAKREMWRERYRQALQRLAGLKGELAKLDQEIPDLQTKYYSWDDPVYRDNVIKPKLDAAMEQAKKLRAEVAEAEQEPAKVKRDARRDGALPGWFRGIDVDDTGTPQ